MSNRQPAVIVDVDDTLCDVSEIRHLYAVPDDFNAFTRASRNCPPRPEVLDWCHRHFHQDGYALLVVTGRSDEFRDITLEWLAEHLPVPYAGLWMRPRGHYGSNVTVKREIHTKLLRSFDIRAAIDDDLQIVEMWAALGIASTLVPDASTWGSAANTGSASGSVTVTEPSRSDDRAQPPRTGNPRRRNRARQE